MEILDIHTHHRYKNPFQAIRNCKPGQLPPASAQGYYSVGFHPWYLSTQTNEDWKRFEQEAAHQQVLAIGETGLDKLTPVAITIQEEAFGKQIEIANRLKKPVIIHCVKAYNEIIHLRKHHRAETDWIIHGFRGKKQLATQLLDHGFYLSFGQKYNEEALKHIPTNKMFIETDESTLNIHLLYEKIAHCRQANADALKTEIQQNIQNVFFFNT